MSVCERDIRSMYQMLYYVCVRMCAYVYCVCACCVCVCVCCVVFFTGQSFRTYIGQKQYPNQQPAEISTQQQTEKKTPSAPMVTKHLSLCPTWLKAVTHTREGGEWVCGVGWGV